MKHAIKERKGKSVALETATTAIVILLLIVTAGAICVGIAFAQSNEANATASVRANQTTQAAQAMQVAETTPQNGQNADDTKAVELVDNESMKVWTDASGDKVPVPRGYVGSQATGENEINTGYVIYEGEDPVTDANVAEAQKTRNQYVWVPVPDASKMYGTDANGKKWGKLYDFATTSIGIDSNYDEKTGAYPLNWSETDGIMSILSSTSYREPDIVIDYDSNLKQYGLDSMSEHELLLEMEKDFNNMIESVEKYGGFYIGRYETGNLSQDVPVVQRENSDIGAQTWYAMYKKCKTLKGTNEQIETGMIWGSQWDRTLMWLIESRNKTKDDICGDSTSWGNYWLSSEPGSGIAQPTGYSETWKANNIYDIAGGIIEETMEVNGAYDKSRSTRAGYYGAKGNGAPASSRDYIRAYEQFDLIRLQSHPLYKVILNPGSNVKNNCQSGDLKNSGIPNS